MKKIFLATILVALVGCDDANTETNVATESNTQSEAPVETIEVTADELLKAYKENELAGDKAYKGKNLIVTGILDSIESGMGDSPYLTLKAGDEYEFNTPQAHFQKSETDSLIELKKGESVTLHCIGNGEIIGSPMISDCKVV